MNLNLLDPATSSMFNKICYVVSILSGTLGIATWWLIQYQPILYVELFIVSGFIILPNLKISMVAKVVSFFIVLNSALVYYGVLLGPVSQIHILVAFLIGAAVLFLKGKKQMVYPIAHVLTMLVFLELNYYYNWLQPIPLKHEIATIIRWIVIFTGSSLSCLVIYFFYKNWVAQRVEKLLGELNAANSQLNEANSQLNESNFALNEAHAVIKKASDEKTAYIQQTTHELRTPIASIIGAVTVLKPRLNVFDEDVQNLIRNIDHSSNVVRMIINQVLDLAKIEAGGMNEPVVESFELRSLIEGCRAMQKYYIANPPEIEVCYDKKLPTEIVIISDKTFLMKILTNLFSNAIKFGSREPVKVEVRRNDDDLYFKISNKGELSSEQLQTMFTPFVSKRGAVDGTGLGLPITRQLIELLGGEIHATCEKGHVVLYFRIPYLAGELKAETEIGNDDKLLNNQTILYVEDDSAWRNILKDYLTRLGALVYTAGNGAEALRILQEKSGEVIFDFIITDEHMPVMGGIELIEKVKGIRGYAHIPVFVTSGSVSGEKVAAFKVAGAAGFIAKPFRFEALLDMITGRKQVSEQVE